jgi:hypothetical protein
MRSTSLRRCVWLPAALFLLLRLGGAMLGGASPASLRLIVIPPDSHWVATWAAGVQTNLSWVGSPNETIREIVFTGAGAETISSRPRSRAGPGATSSRPRPRAGERRAGARPP